MSLDSQIQQLTEFLNENNIEINHNSLELLIKNKKITSQISITQTISIYLLFESNKKENIECKKDKMYKNLLKKENIFDGYFLINSQSEFISFNKENKTNDAAIDIINELNYSGKENIIKENNFIDYFNVFRNKIFIKLKSTLNKTKELKHLLYFFKKIFPSVYFDGFLIDDEKLINYEFSQLNNDFFQTLKNQPKEFNFELIRTSHNGFSLITNNISLIIKRFNFDYKILFDKFPLSSLLSKSLDNIYSIQTLESKPIKLLIISDNLIPLSILFYKKMYSNLSQNLSRKYINTFLRYHGLSEHINQVFIDLFILYSSSFPNISLISFFIFSLNSLSENIVFNIKNKKFFLNQDIPFKNLKEKYNVSSFILKEEDNYELILPFNISIIQIIKSHINNLQKLSFNNNYDILKPHYNSFDIILSQKYIINSLKVKSTLKSFLCPMEFINKFKEFCLIFISNDKVFFKFLSLKDHISNELKKSIILEGLMEFGFEYIWCNKEFSYLFN